MKLETIQGHFIFEYYNKDGFGIYQFKYKKKHIRVLGNFYNVNFDLEYKLNGYTVEHEIYGSQFKVESYELIQLDNDEAKVTFLASKLFKQVNKRMAKKIVKTLDGKDLFDLVSNDTILDSVPKMTTDIKTNILEVLKSFDPEMIKVFKLFSDVGLPLDKLAKIQAVYLDKIYDIITQNPFRLMDDFNFFNFDQIDKIASQVKLDKNNVFRLARLLEKSVLSLCFEYGDTYCLKQELLKYVASQLDEDAFNVGLNKALESKYLYLSDHKIYHHSQYESERQIADFLSLFPRKVKYDSLLIHENIKMLEIQFQINYSSLQIHALQKVFENTFTIITGGAGTGKTTIIKSIIAIHQCLFPLNSITVLAPTGRASKRISELNKVEAKTIHSLLKWNKDTNTFLHNKDNPLYLDTVIIDELSMVDNYLFARFLEACPNLSRLILLGDVNQLPSVSLGNLLADLIDCGCFEVVYLKNNFRQAKDQDIIGFCRDILTNSIDFNKYQNDVLLIENYSLKNEFLLNSIKSYLDEGYSWDNIQIMAPMKNTRLGVKELNSLIQENFNPYSATKKEYRSKQHCFRVGDKILQLKNQSELDIYNGDIGILIDVINYKNKKDVELIVDYDGNKVTYGSADLENITLGYALTIHKAQGSEYEFVYLVLDSSSRKMFYKQLFYTASSRAKQKLYILGNKEEFITYSQRNLRKRKTTLKERLLSSNIK